MSEESNAVLVDFALADLKLWIEGGLGRLKTRTVYDDRGPWGSSNSYAVAEFPEWDLRQKVDLIESANSDAVRILDINSRLVACLKEALAQTGCDGDLCNHRWHETARQLFSEVEEAIASQPKTNPANFNVGAYIDQD
jgi:hypothetical protein